MTTTKIIIPRDSSPGNHVDLGVLDVQAFEQERQRQEAQGQQGDALVNALLAAQPENIPFVKRYDSGSLNDGPNGEAAMITDFSDQGAGYKVEHFAHGFLQDPADGSPAVTICRKSAEYADRAAVAKHYQNNRAHDGAGGAPSYQIFNAAGKLVSAWRTTEKNAGIPIGRIGRARMQKKLGLTAPTRPY